MPWIGDTVNTPGVGAALVTIKTLDVTALPPADAVVKVKVRYAFAGRVFACRAKLNMNFEVPIDPAGTSSTRLNGVVKPASRATEVSFTDHVTVARVAVSIVAESFSLSKVLNFPTKSVATLVTGLVTGSTWTEVEAVVDLELSDTATVKSDVESAVASTAVIVNRGLKRPTGSIAKLQVEFALGSTRVQLQ